MLDITNTVFASMYNILFDLLFEKEYLKMNIAH